jgi:hypothetical protein
MQKLILILSLFMATNVAAQVPADGPFRSEMDSVIAWYVDKVNADSIQSYMQALEDMGTRFCLADNRRDVSVWIMNKFIEFGYPDTKLDSFPLNRWYGGSYYQTWQYNVESTFDGYEYPDDIYIVGGHHDAISNNAFVLAPGADDNASGTAAALEIARVMNEYGYAPESTIKFITFAAEELGLHGSWHYADNAASQNMDIKMMLNNDMISYCTLPQDQWTIRFVKYPNSLWVTNLAHHITDNFTILNSLESTQYSQQSDSYPFYANGFNTIFFIEDQFTPYYHTTNDLVSTTNKDFAAEVVKISLGMLIHENGPGLNTGVIAQKPAPMASLSPNYPNPFSNETTINYTLKQDGHITLKVFDAANRLMAVLHDGRQKSGSHRIMFDAGGLPAGIYICLLQTGYETSAIKLVVSK